MKIICSLTSLLLFLSLSCDQVPDLPGVSHTPDSLPDPAREKTGTSDIVFRSADYGETWQDVSDGLPEGARVDSLGGRKYFFADDNGLWLTSGNGIYLSKPGYSSPFWTKATIPDGRSNITPGKDGIFAFHHQSGIMQKAIGSDEWSPVFTDFREMKVRSVTQTSKGTLFVSTDKGMFRSVDQGKSWKTFPVGGLGMKVVESEGVLLTTGNRGIIRSADDGQNWSWVIRDGGVGIDVASINGGFAAITYSTESRTRRVRTSYDGGKTWQAVDEGLPAQLSISTIVQVGDDLFCGHPNGVFRSSDKGKTWKLLLPSIKDKVFHLVVSGNVIYAIPRNAGC